MKNRFGRNIPTDFILWENTQLLNTTIHTLIEEIFEYYTVDKNYFYTLHDDGEKIKITQMRDFISQWNIKSSFLFQVFFIENIGRATVQSLQSCLKFFEEPWVWNIIIMTNTSESGILETILSRVQIIQFFSHNNFITNDFFFDLIDDYIYKKNVNLLQYFFHDKKITKQDYIDFLHTFIFYIKTNFVLIHLLDQIEESLHLIQKNNVLPKYEIDRLLLKL